MREPGLSIDLVYAPSTTGSDNYSSEPPLGPLALYSSLPVGWRNNARFLDGTVLSFNEIVRSLREREANIVAMSCNSFNYSSSLELAEISKSWGATLVFGGIHVTHRHDAILAKMGRGTRPIDYLVSGYGEHALYPLLKALRTDQAPTDIPNISFIDRGKTVINPVVYPSRGVDPLNVPIDYSGIKFAEYAERYERFGNLKTVRIPGSMFTQRGCAYVNARKCVFCSIEEVNPRRPGHLIEEDIVALISEHQTDHIRINDGDFTVNARHMRVVAESADRAAERAGSMPTFYCLGRTDEVDEKRVGWLNRLNVVSVFLGYESGSDRMLRQMQKHTTCQKNLAATRLLKENGIDVICGGLVLGAEGENEETLEETLEFVCKLKEVGNTRSLIATPLVPLPGSPSFGRLMQALRVEDPGQFTQFSKADVFDLEEMAAVWNRHFCDVPLDRLWESAAEIAGMFKQGIRWFD